MARAGNADNAQSARPSDSSHGSSSGHHPVDDPLQHQQYNYPPEYNQDPSMQEPQPPPGQYPQSEPSVSQGQYHKQTRYANPNASTWQEPGAGEPPPPGYPPAPPHEQYGYSSHAQGASSYSEHQQPQYQHQYEQHQPHQYASSPYNNSTGPTRPPPGGYYPQHQQPGPQVIPPPMPPLHSGLIRPDLGPPGPWATDIVGFLQDCDGCLLTIVAPCITFGQIAEIVDTGYNPCATAGTIYALACLLGIPCLYSYTYRTKMRRHFNLRPDPLDDLCVHFWCEQCAISQEYRELRYRGIDPNLGYAMQQNIIRQAMDHPGSPSMAAPVAMNMMK